MLRVIASLIHRLLDFVVPRGCAGCEAPVHERALWCADCSESVVTLPNDLVQTVQGHRLISVFAYGGPVANTIHRLKYKNRPELALGLGRRLAREVTLAKLPQDSVIVPVPATAERIVERGYNQAALLASAIARNTEFCCRPTALKRIHSGQHQVGADKAQRAQLVAGAFVASARLIKNANVILVDDVVTTGATSAACAEAIEAAGAQLVAIVAVARVL